MPLTVQLSLIMLLRAIVINMELALFYICDYFSSIDCTD